MKTATPYQLPFDMPCAIVLVKVADMKWSHFSPFFKELTGFEAFQFDAGTISIDDIVHDDYAEEVFLQRIKNFQLNAPYTFEYPIVHASGKEIWVREIGAPTVDEKGADLYTLVFQDLGLLKKKVNDLERIKSIVHIAHKAGKVGVYYYELKSMKLHWSSQLKQIFQLNKEPESEEYWAMIHPDDYASHREETTNMIYDRIPVVNRMVRMIRPSDKKVLYILTGGTAVVNDNDEVVGAAGSVVDVTEFITNLFSAKGFTQPDMNDQLQQIKSEVDNTFFMKVDNKLVSVKPEEIMYVEAMGDYMKIKTKSKDLPFVVHMTMKKAEETLPASLFFQAHRSYLINLKFIESIDKNHLVLCGNKIPLSKSRRKELLQKIQA